MASQGMIKTTSSSGQICPWLWLWSVYARNTQVPPRLEEEEIYGLWRVTAEIVPVAAAGLSNN